MLYSWHIVKMVNLLFVQLRYSNTMGCPSVREDNPRAFTSKWIILRTGGKHVITIVYHLHQWISRVKVGKGGINLLY